MFSSVPFPFHWGALLLRLLARIRSEHPVAPVLMGLLIGQMLGWWIEGAALVALIFGGCIGLWMLRRAPGRAVVVPLGSGLLLGVVTMGWQLATTDRVSNDHIVSGGHRLLIRLRDVRRPEPGAVVFDAIVDQALSDNARTVIPPGTRVFCRAVDLPWRSIAGARRGDRYVISAELHRVPWAVSPFGYEGALRRRGVEIECRVRFAALFERSTLSWAERWREHTQAKVRGTLGNHERAGLVLALVLGTRDAVSARTERVFRDTGLAHALVLSGYQISLVYGVLFAFLAAGTRLGQAWSARLLATGTAQQMAGLAALCGTTLFVVIVGFEHSASRALIGLAGVVLARAIFRMHFLWQSILLAMLAMSIIWPGIMFEPGPQLTFAALWGIAFGAVPRSAIDSALRRSVRASFWATIFPMLVGVAWFGSFPLIGVVLNPLVAPVLAVVGTIGGGVATLAVVLGLHGAEQVLTLIADLLCVIRDILASISRIAPPVVPGGLWGSGVVLLVLMSFFLADLRTLARRWILSHNFYP